MIDTSDVYDGSRHVASRPPLGLPRKSFGTYSRISKGAWHIPEALDHQPQVSPSTEVTVLSLNCPNQDSRLWSHLLRHTLTFLACADGIALKRQLPAAADSETAGCDAAGRAKRRRSRHPKSRRPAAHRRDAPAVRQDRENFS